MRGVYPTARSTLTRLPSPSAWWARERIAPARQEDGDERVGVLGLDRERGERHGHGEREVIALRARGRRAPVRRVGVVDPHRRLHEPAELGIVGAGLELERESEAGGAPAATPAGPRDLRLRASGSRTVVVVAGLRAGGVLRDFVIAVRARRPDGVS